MRIVYHFPLCPFSRKVRLVLGEKKLDFALENEKFWEKRPQFIRLNPLGAVPVFIDLNGTQICDSYAICEYLEEAYPQHKILGEHFPQRAEIRRLTAWFDGVFAQEVTMPVFFEKVLKRHLAGRAPDSGVLRQAREFIGSHLEYIGWLTDRRNWLAGDDFSLADITAASHLSVLDYFGDIRWDMFEAAKTWYSRVKSRPSFRGLLQDTAPGLTASAHYADLDF